MQRLERETSKQFRTATVISQFAPARDSFSPSSPLLYSQQSPAPSPLPPPCGKSDSPESRPLPAAEADVLDTMSLKRSVSVDTTSSDSKRPRLASLEDQNSGEQQPGTTQVRTEEDVFPGWVDEAVPSLTPTVHHFARSGIQRSIALVLAHDGFQSATPEALESFTELVEQCTSLSPT